MRIGYDDADSLLTYPYVNNLSVYGQPIRIRAAQAGRIGQGEGAHGTYPHTRSTSTIGSL